MNYKWKHCATVEEEGMKEDAWGADVVHICLCNFRLMNKDPVRPLLRKLKFPRPHCSKTKNFISKTVKVQLFLEGYKNLRRLSHGLLSKIYCGWKWQKNHRKTMCNLAFIKVQLFWEGHKICRIFLYLNSKRQNHEEDCTNFCGLLRRAELYWRKVSVWMPHVGGWR